MNKDIAAAVKSMGDDQQLYKGSNLSSKQKRLRLQLQKTAKLDAFLQYRDPDEEIALLENRWPASTVNVQLQNSSTISEGDDSAQHQHNLPPADVVVGRSDTDETSIEEFNNKQSSESNHLSPSNRNHMDGMKMETESTEYHNNDDALTRSNEQDTSVALTDDKPYPSTASDQVSSVFLDRQAKTKMPPPFKNHPSSKSNDLITKGVIEVYNLYFYASISNRSLVPSNLITLLIQKIFDQDARSDIDRIVVKVLVSANRPRPNVGRSHISHS